MMHATLHCWISHLYSYCCVCVCVQCSIHQNNGTNEFLLAKSLAKVESIGCETIITLLLGPLQAIVLHDDK